MNVYFSDPVPKGESYFDPFVAYSSVHLNTLIVMALIIVGTLIILNKIKSERVRKVFRYSLGIILVAQDIFYMLWRVSQDTFTIANDLPFHPCRFMVYAAFLMLITKDYRIFEVMFFTGIASLLGPVGPDVPYSFPHVQFFLYFFSHGAILLSSLYMAIVEGYEPTIKSYVKAVIFCLVYMLAMFPINWITGGNYTFVMGHPQGDTVLHLLGPWPIYIFNMMLMTVAIFFILGYLPFLIKKKLFTPKNLEKTIVEPIDN